MRTIIAAVGAVVVISLAVPASSLAQTESVQAAFNRCVALALQRGYSTSDLDGNREAVRNFVIKCMQGLQQ